MYSRNTVHHILSHKQEVCMCVFKRKSLICFLCTSRCSTEHTEQTMIANEISFTQDFQFIFHKKRLSLQLFFICIKELIIFVFDELYWSQQVVLVNAIQNKNYIYDICRKLKIFRHISIYFIQWIFWLTGVFLTTCHKIW